MVKENIELIVKGIGHLKDNRLKIKVTLSENVLSSTLSGIEKICHVCNGS